MRNAISPEVYREEGDPEGDEVEEKRRQRLRIKTKSGNY
jgi:hypothetical protein